MVRDNGEAIGPKDFIAHHDAEFTAVLCLVSLYEYL